MALGGHRGARLRPVEHDPVRPLLDAPQPARLLGERDAAVRLDVGDECGGNQVSLPARRDEPLDVLDQLRIGFLELVADREEADRDRRSIVGRAAEHSERVVGAQLDQLAPALEIVLRLRDLPAAAQALARLRVDVGRDLPRRGIELGVVEAGDRVDAAGERRVLGDVRDLGPVRADQPAAVTEARPVLLAGHQGRLRPRLSRGPLLSDRHLRPPEALPRSYPRTASTPTCSACSRTEGGHDLFREELDRAHGVFPPDARQVHPGDQFGRPELLFVPLELHRGELRVADHVPRLEVLEIDLRCRRHFLTLVCPENALPLRRLRAVELAEHIGDGWRGDLLGSLRRLGDEDLADHRTLLDCEAGLGGGLLVDPVVVP